MIVPGRRPRGSWQVISPARLPIVLPDRRRGGRQARSGARRRRLFVSLSPSLLTRRLPCPSAGPRHLRRPDGKDNGQAPAGLGACLCIAGPALESGDCPHRAGDGPRPVRAGSGRGAGRVHGRGPVHRLPDQVPDQAGRPLPPGAGSRRTGSRGPAGRGAAVPTVLADVRELAAVRRPAQERPAGPGARLL